MINSITRFAKRDQRGFTLIELLVVVAIIAILAALILAALNSAQQGSRDSRRKSDLNQYKTALANYQSDNNDYPGTGNVAPTDTGTPGPCGSLVSNYMSKCLFPPTQGGFSYIYVRGSSTTWCMVTQLERQPGTGFEVTPTYSGAPANAPTPGTANGTACAASA